MEVYDSFGQKKIDRAKASKNNQHASNWTNLNNTYTIQPNLHVLYDSPKMQERYNPDCILKKHQHQVQVWFGFIKHQQ